LKLAQLATTVGRFASGAKLDERVFLRVQSDAAAFSRRVHRDRRRHDWQSDVGKWTPDARS
jgi:hypothetical protein